MTLTTTFSHLTKTSLLDAGGKGANLGELTSAGFPVPPGFVLTTAAYDAFVEANQLQPRIVELAQSVTSAEPQSSQIASTQIQALFANATMPDAIADAILAAAAELNADTLAVRSSATAEDLPDASFAGQQDTYLNVQGDAALLDAVKQCWASLWTPRAIVYRLRQAIDPDAVSLAVVVQQFVNAEASGVLFTANPITGERDELVINATWGLGEAIVGGHVTPDTLIVDKASHKVIQRDIPPKAVMIVQSEGGTAEQAVPVGQQTEAVLSDASAETLAQFGTQIEAHYAMAMDVEWAIADGKLWILQARPITSLPAAPLKNVVWEPVIPDTVWMRRQIVEHMPEPLSPLFEDLYLDQGLDASIGELIDAMGEMGGTKLDWYAMLPVGLAGTINGYAYTTGSINLDVKNVLAVLKIYANIYKFFRLAAFDWDSVVLPSYQATIAHWGRLDLATASNAVLLQGIADMAMADSHYWWGSALKLGISRMLDPVFDLLLRAPFIRYALPHPRPVSASFLRGLDSKALEAQADLEAIASAIGQSPTLHQTVLESDPAQLLNTLSNQPDAQPIVDRIQRHLDLYGHQISNLDFAAPPLSEEPAPILWSLQALVKSPPTDSTRIRQAKMAAEREELVLRTRWALNPLSRLIFDLMWKWTKEVAPYRENVVFYLGAAWPTLRKLAHELGQRLTQSGAIAAPDDIYYLTGEEISAVADANPVPDYTERVQQRRTLREARMQLTPPPTVPERGELMVGPFKMSMFRPTPTDDGSEGAVLKGYAVSTGKVTAPASVIHSLDDFSQMQPGSILVCTTTTPAWTPLFSQAAGLVTDVGGALAHGSIVAREYGIPAVMGTGVATERIQSGMLLTVDGDAGTVTLVDEVDPLAEQARQQEEATAQQGDNRRKWALAAAVAAVVGFILWRKRRR